MTINDRDTASKVLAKSVAPSGSANLCPRNPAVSNSQTPWHALAPRERCARGPDVAHGSQNRVFPQVRAIWYQNYDI